MNIEEMTLERRAARLAALADPARLHIADLLTLGDRSPSELQESLGISSSLLAHHLNLLEREGILVRSRSEADRRRSYVRLVPGAFDGLAPRSAAEARRIVFVCTANSARSQLAAALWQQASDVPVASAGTHPAAAIERGALAAAKRHGMSMAAITPRALVDVLEQGDWIVTVCDTAHEELGLDRSIHWSIPDPVRVGTDAAFDEAFDAIARRIEDFAPHLTPA
ncbi:MAG: ArsR family transcriptional regulator [Micrococcales bacterium 73-13]|nr:MAG: ArsR family transcriptional regulator [Micrococcales bacterium 73-13]